MGSVATFQASSARRLRRLLQKEWRLLFSLSTRRDSIAQAYAPIGVRLAPDRELALLEAQCAELRELLRLRAAAAHNPLSAGGAA